MSHKKRFHDDTLPITLKQYAYDRTLDFHQYSEYHMRLMDGGFTVLDVWTTGRYYIMSTDYAAMLGEETIIERGGEKGQLPATRTEVLQDWLDRLFFPEMEVQK